MEKYRRALFALRILICLVGAGLMLDGAILGETTIKYRDSTGNNWNRSNRKSQRTKRIAEVNRYDYA